MICHSERSDDSLYEIAERFFASLRMTTLFGLLLAACASPESGRLLGDGPGADVKNWGHPVQLHAGAQPYHNTPCATEPVECHGPPPVFGPTPPPD
jgi:hypothetical protein